MEKAGLLIIDPQIDFCDPDKGSLYVGGAEKDMRRVADMISRIGNKLSSINVTMDTHHYVDIAHPVFWKNSKGENPNPFTIISRDDVENSVWMAAMPSFQKHALEYVRKLEANNRYPLCIWPYHCLIGSEGHMVFPELYRVLTEWEFKFRMVNYVTKGSNFLTEHYSAVKADVPDPGDPSTQINTGLIEVLEKMDKVLICGEAQSHCVLNTVKDIIAEISDQSYAKKFVILSDGMSNVQGFEQQGEDFITEMKGLGIEVTTTDRVYQ